MNQSMLIIDDDTAVLTSCQRIFTEEGFKVTTTTNPSEGIELATSNQYTVILCDWHMPELDGMDVVTRLLVWTIKFPKTLQRQSPRR